jgi:bifunctional DNA-binding transcriptional regulator/antitoxin component of YhaV-PrlF toxin-antitoxin module
MPTDSRGQVTIPRAYRERLGLTLGVDLVIEWIEDAARLAKARERPDS